jgi:hypothetical protein
VQKYTYTSFIMIGSSIQKLIGEDTQTHRQHGDFISLLLFLQNMEIWIKFGRYFEGSGRGLIKALFSIFSSRD